MPFDVSWTRVKADLANLPEFQPGYRGLTIEKWTRDKGDMGETFAVLYKGDTLWCETATTNNLRPVSPAEVRKVYDLWPDYLARRAPRSEIRDLVHNATWIIALLKHFEPLMEDE